MEIKMEHVFYILIVILFVALMNKCNVEGLDLEYVNKMTSEQSVDFCKHYDESGSATNPNCLSKFYYNTDTNKIEACIGVYIDENYMPTGINCRSPHGSIEGGKTVNQKMYSKLLCGGDFNTCPTCDNNTYYSLDSNPCTKNLDQCNECLNSNTISWNNPNSFERMYSSSGRGPPESISYNGSNPLKDCNNTTNFCEQIQGACFDDIREMISDIKENSSGTCSNESILETIEGRSIISDKCKYDKVSVTGEDVWLKQFLETDGYCDRNRNSEWRCQRSLPAYCKGDNCEYDMTGKQCICKHPNVPLQNDTCGIPDCGPAKDGLCVAGQICRPSTVTGPQGVGETTYSCVKPNPNS